MILASKAFFLFLLVVLVVYHGLPRRSWKYTALLLASWAFYAWVPPHYLWVLLALTGIDFVAAKKIEAASTDAARRRWLTLSIVSNLSLLFAFKYTAFGYDVMRDALQLTGSSLAERAWSIALPLGISFHTFQGISYTVDVYRGQIRAVHRFLDYALFVAFFPQLAAGPIVRAVEFLPQMTEPPRVSAQQIGEGISLFAGGLFKKLVIADNLDMLIVSPVFGDPGSYDPAMQRWALIAWMVQIYCDFSGYSDMAIGTAKWFGFELPPNFNAPYLATSISDFWRRWHLSLSTWLRDYLYYPLGGSRCGELRTAVNLFIVFVLCGLWHGATLNWLVYGIMNGVLMSGHRYLDRVASRIPALVSLRATTGWKLLGWMTTMVVLLVGLVIIRMPSWDSGLTIMSSLFEWGTSTTQVPVLVVTLIGLGLVGHLVALARETGLTWSGTSWEIVRPAIAAVLLGLTVVAAPGVSKTFIYIQF